MEYAYKTNHKKKTKKHKKKACEQTILAEDPQTFCFYDCFDPRRHQPHIQQKQKKQKHAENQYFIPTYQNQKKQINVTKPSNNTTKQHKQHTNKTKPIENTVHTINCLNFFTTINNNHCS